MRPPISLVILTMLLLLLPGCAGASGGSATPTGVPPTIAPMAPPSTGIFAARSGSATSAPDPPAAVGAPCPVTRPNLRVSLSVGNMFWNYGNDGLWTNVPSEGVWFFGGRQVQADGSLWDKLPWWREGKAVGTLVVMGRRLDTPAPPLTAGYPDTYGISGVQAGGLTFPTEGCWEVTGQSGAARVAFVVLVRQGNR